MPPQQRYIIEIKGCAEWKPKARLVILRSRVLMPVDNYLPLDAADLATRVPLVAVPPTVRFSCVVGAVPGAGTSGVTVASRRRTSTEFMVVSGLDRSGLPWEVELPTYPIGCSLWLGDLDHDGTTDLVFLGSTGACGIAPTSHLTVLLFEDQGRLVPWSADGYFEEDAQGVRDILDLDGDGRAEVVRMSLSDRMWITSVYEAEDARFRRIDGAHGRHSFPLLTRYTNAPNHVATVPPPGRDPHDDDLTDGAARPWTRIVSMIWPNVALSENPVLRLDDGQVCRPTAWYSTAAVVIDRVDSRDAALLGGRRACSGACRRDRQAPTAGRAPWAARQQRVCAGNALGG
jgi:hypothetical protein